MQCCVFHTKQTMIRFKCTNCNSETDTILGKADYTVISTICHYILMFSKYQNTVIKLGQGDVAFMKEAKR
jgi:formate dehydrogenase maturation protein FdhE